MSDKMTYVNLSSMFLLGLFGFGHCVGMCGPLVLAFPARVGGFSAHLLYHAGRLATYVLCGTFLGGLASIAQVMDPAAAGSRYLEALATIQVAFSGLAALLLLFLGLIRLGILSEPSWLTSATPARLHLWRRLVARVREMPGPAGMFAAGLLMGLLPCGLSYAAFARAVAEQSAASGAVMVAAFGLGTLPGLLLFGAGGARLARNHRRQMEIVSGLIMVGMALKLGLDLVVAL